MDQTSRDPWAFCRQILPEVSRSFALIIPKCPPPIDRSLCVAYLLCRVADTIEDQPSLAAEVRQRLYERFLAAVNEPDRSEHVVAFQADWQMPPEGAYGRLILGLPKVMAAYLQLPAACRQPIQQCVFDMVAGMRQMVAVEVKEGVAFYCRDLAELDRYCHCVAGTVGIMSTALFELHLSDASANEDFHATAQWREAGRRMGLGLQMTNIVKDCRIDAERGVSFVPSRYVTFQSGGYDLTGSGRAELIAHTIDHLDAAMEYIVAVPSRQTGIRTFLLGAVFPAIATMEIAAAGKQRHPKISRLRMGHILAVIARDVADNQALNRWYQNCRDDVRRKLQS